MEGLRPTVDGLCPPDRALPAAWLWPDGQGQGFSLGLRKLYGISSATKLLIVHSPIPVISTGEDMPGDSTAKNRYSFEEWRNLSCVREYQAFSGNRGCKLTVNIFQGDFSTLSHKLFLRISSFHRLPPLEMTGGGVEPPI